MESDFLLGLTFFLRAELLIILIIYSTTLNEQCEGAGMCTRGRPIIFYLFFIIMQTNILFTGDIIYWWINNTREII